MECIVLLPQYTAIFQELGDRLKTAQGRKDNIVDDTSTKHSFKISTDILDRKQSHQEGTDCG